MKMAQMSQLGPGAILSSVVSCAESTVPQARLPRRTNPWWVYALWVIVIGMLLYFGITMLQSQMWVRE
jgi:type VI protein secretion system component VasF